MENLIPSDVQLEIQEHEERPQYDRQALKQASQPNFRYQHQALPPPPQRDRRATVSEVPDFPLPRVPLKSNKYTYKPDAAFKDLFPEGDRPSEEVQAHMNRRRGDHLGLSNDGPIAGRKFGRPLSQQFAFSSNLPSASLDSFPRPNYVLRSKRSIDTDKSTPQTDTTEYPWNASTTATSTANTPGYAYTKQLPMPDQVKSRCESIEAAIAAERGPSGNVRRMHSAVSITTPQTTTTREPSRPRSRKHSVTQGIKDYIRPRSSDGRDRSVSRPGTAQRSDSRPSRAISRTPSIAQSIKDYIRPPSSDGRHHSISMPDTAQRSESRTSRRSRPQTAKRSESQGSQRSNASSGVLPVVRHRFSWKSFRQSWSSFRSAADSDVEGEGARGRADKRKSRDDPKKSQINLNRELPPLPGLDQWKGEEVVESKPKHIASLWNSKALKRRSQELSKKKSGDLSKRMSLQDISKRWSGDASRMISPDIVMDVVEPSIPEAEPLKIDVIEETPTKPEVKAVAGAPIPGSSKNGSPKMNRKPVPLQKSQSPPADSVLGDQDRNGSVRSAMKPPVEVRIPSGYVTASTSLSPLPMLDGQSEELAPSAAQMDNLVDSLPQEASQQVDESEAAVVSPSKRRPSKLDLDGIAHASPKLYDREFNHENGETQFVERNMSINDYHRATSSKYKYADEISTLSSPPPVPPKDSGKKSKWPFRSNRTKRQSTWMDEMEKLGIKDGLLLTDDLEGSPIVRY